MGLLAGLSAACSSAPVARSAAPPVPSQAAVLVRGVPVEHEIASGGKDVYELRIEGRSYLELAVEQTEAVVAVELAGPDGSRRDSVDDPGPTFSERLAVIAPVAGTYLVTITPTPSDPQAAGGRYRVKLVELRPAAAGDDDRVAAEKLLRKGRGLRFRAPPDRSGALQLDRDALARWQAAGDVSGQARAMVELGETEQRLGHSSEALCWFQSALKLANTSDDEEMARALFGLGEVQGANGSSEVKETALESYRQAIELWK